MVFSRSFFVSLLVSAALSTAHVPDTVGQWSSPTNSLPDNKLPDVPLLGNGHIGVLLDAHDKNSAPADSVGPGRASTLDMWLGSSSMWSCRNYTGVAAGMCGAVSLGGVSFSLDGSSIGSPTFSATQSIGDATLGSRWATAAGGVFTTQHFMHPVLDIIVTQLLWNPGPKETAMAVVVNVSTWVSAASGSHGSPTPVAVGCLSAHNLSVVSCSTGMPASPVISLATRAATSGDASKSSPRPIRAGLASGVVSDGASGAGPFAWGDASPSNAAWGSWVAINVSAGTSVYVITATAEVSSSQAADPALSAAATLSHWLSLDGVATVRSARDAWWAEFWSRSSVALPDTPALQALFDGAQYIIACSSSTNETVPPPALYGPWVTSDGASWNGDYTLDYNFESTYFGVFASNHAPQFTSYVTPLMDWWQAGKVQAQAQAQLAHVVCPDTAVHFACHLAPWGFQSDDQTIYMHWNAAFSFLPIASQWEFTHDIAAATAVYPLLAGHMDWWACYLKKTEFINGSGYVYHDWNAFNPDAEHEGQLVPDPMIGLALIARSAGILIDMAVGLGLPVPASAVDILLHLTPYPTEVIPVPGPPGPVNFTVMSNTRLAGDFHMGSDPTVAACEVACNSVTECECFTYCASPDTPGCPDGPSCWFYTGNLSAHAGPGFTAGCRVTPPQPSDQNTTVWTAYAGAKTHDSDTFSFYPVYPAESLDGVQPLSVADRITAQVSTVQYVGNWASTSRPLDVFVASIKAISGGGKDFSGAFSRDAILSGLTAWLKADFGRNQLAYAPGGGVENAGVSRAVTEFLLGSGVLVPAVSMSGDAHGAQWYARLFPAWPSTYSASFDGLIAKGGCQYSAATAAGQGISSPVTVVPSYPGAGGVYNCTTLSPWPGQEASVHVACKDGSTPTLQWLTVDNGGASALALSFVGTKGISCQICSGAC